MIPDAWEALNAEVLPHLIEPDRGRDQLRVWSVGCASGEEPYSLAMQLSELLGQTSFNRRVKIYATDLDDAALNTARHATYLPRAVEGVPEPLRSKYFERTSQHYVVSRDLRKAVIFGRHNIVHDAPISRIDLLVCRNLLIYLETETQNVVLPRLHYAMVDNGFLFLGKAETLLGAFQAPTPINMKHRLSAGRAGVAPRRHGMLHARRGDPRRRSRRRRSRRGCWTRSSTTPPPPTSRSTTRTC